MIKRFGGHAGQESILNDHRRSSSEVPNEPSIDIAGEFAPSLATQQTRSLAWSAKCGLKRRLPRF